MTRDIFRLEVNKSGFYETLADEVNNGLNYDGIINKYNEELGFEARVILRALLNSKNNEVLNKSS